MGEDTTGIATAGTGIGIGDMISIVSIVDRATNGIGVTGMDVHGMIGIIDTATTLIATATIPVIGTTIATALTAILRTPIQIRIGSAPIAVAFLGVCYESGKRRG